MGIPTWVLPAPVLLAPGQRVAAYQLRELIVRFPPDAAPGGSLVLTPLKADGQPYPDALAVPLTPDNLTALGAVTDAVLAQVVAMFNAHDVCDLTKATLELRLPVAPVVATPAAPAPPLGGLG